MAVLQMRRISICALKKNRKAILERLQELGAVEIDVRLEDDSGYDQMDTSGYRASFEKQANAADQAVEVLDRYVPLQKSLLSSLAGKELRSRNVMREVEAKKDEKTAKVSKILELDKQVAENKAEILRLQTQKESLMPWISLDVPMNFKGTKKTRVLIGTMPSQTTVETIENAIASKSEEPIAYEAEILSRDKDYVYLTFLCLKQDVQPLEEILRTIGFARPSGTVAEIPVKMQEEIDGKVQELEEKITVLEELIREFADSREDIELISDYYRTRAEKYRVLGKLPQTKYTFALSGYVVASEAERVKEELEQKFQASVELEEMKEQEEPPVVLKNNRFSEAVEGVLASFGMPHKGEVDPTVITSLFYVFLFGLMLSDAAYGLIMVIACGIVLKKFPRMEASLRKSIKLFYYCGYSTLFWGVMFGGYFGDAVDVISRVFFHHEVSIPPLWFAPLADPMKLLMYSWLFGVIHLYAGLGMKGYICLKDKKYVDFFCDVVLWFCLLTGLILILLPTELFGAIAGSMIVFPAPLHFLGKALAIIGAVGILLMSGRANKNPGVRIALGAYDLYNITGWMSDVLSYSRLLALGLATGVMASVFNQMGSMGGDSVVGVILFIVVFLIGHTFNMAINLLGAYVHTCRLQYVEFFGKFYEGGGKAFEPFKQNTKYFEFKEDTQS